MVGYWTKKIHMAKGEVQDVTVELSGHSTWDDASDTVSVAGLLPGSH